MKCKILLLDNDVFACKYLDAMIRSSNQSSQDVFFDVKFCTSAAQAIYQCNNSQYLPDVLLVDMELNDISGVNVIEEVRKNNDSIGIIGITSYPLEHYRHHVKAAGAQSLISKNVKFGQLADAILHVAKGFAYPPHEFLDVKESYEIVAKRHNIFDEIHLTEMEKMICIEYARGYSPSEIANYLKMSTSTVYSHKRNILSKIDNSMTWEEFLCFFVK